MKHFQQELTANEILMHFRASKKLNNEVSLEDPIGKDKDDNTISLKDILEIEERSIDEEIDIKMKIKKMKKKMDEVLKEREKKILEMRYGLNGQKIKTQMQIAKQMGISRSYVSRIETKAIEKLAIQMRED